MSDPKVTIQVSESGARQTQRAIQGVASAQTRVTAASRQSADAVSRLSAAQRSQAAAAADAALASDKLAAGLSRKASPAVAKLGKAADKTWSTMRFLANLLPNFGIGGFITVAIAGFVALRRAMSGAGESVAAYTRILGMAQRQTEAYVKAVEQLPQLTARQTIQQVRLNQALTRTATARAEMLAMVASAEADLRSADIDERGAESALRNAASIDEMAAANARVRKAQQRRKQATLVLQNAQLRLTYREEQHVKALEASRRAEQERALATYRFRDALVGLAGTLSGAGSTGVYGALQAVEHQATRTFGAIAQAVEREQSAAKARRERARQAARESRQRQRDIDTDARLAAMDLEYAGAEAQARGQASPQGYLGIVDGLNAVSQAATSVGDAMRDAARATGESISRFDEQRKAAVAMTNAVTASAQSYASAALGAALYGGSISEAINATARAAFVEGTVGALGALAKAAVFSIINPPGVAPMLAAAKLYGAQAALAGAIAGATGGLAGGGGGGGGGSTAITEPTPADFGEPERRERQDSELFVNFASGQGSGRPPSRAEASAAAFAIIDLFRAGGLRLETSRA